MAVGTAGLSSRPSAHRNMRWYAAATPAKPAPMMAILNGSGSPGVPSSEAVAAARDPPRAPRTHRLAPSSGGETGGRRGTRGGRGAGPSRDAPRRSLGDVNVTARATVALAAALAIASTRTGARACARRSAAAARSSRRWRGSRTSPRTLSRTSPRPRAQRSRAEAAETAPAVGVTRGDASESAPAATGGPRSLAGFIEVRGERARVGETVTPKSCRG